MKRVRAGRWRRSFDLHVLKTGANEGQQSFVALTLEGHNVALLGKAGTGKPYIMKSVVSILSQTKHVKVTSSTGMSSWLFDDTSTLHSFSGIGICREGKEEILKRIEQRQDKLSAWAALDVLFIDEGAQISCRLFETVEYIARNIQKSTLPFGGLQVIFSGDFYQLGPVKNEFDPALYTFQSYLWDSVFPHVIVLAEVVRQGEKDFIQFLSRLAEGSCTQADVTYVKEFQYNH